jgi:putative sigma-54 modulation protein
MAKMVFLSRSVRPQVLPGEKRYSFGRGISLDLRVSTAVSIRKGVDLVPIIISTRHGHVSEATQDKIREKLERLTRFYDRIISMELTIDLEHREQPRVDLRASAKDKHDFLASAATEDLLGSLDMLVEKMEHQFRKHKEKVVERHRNPGRRHEEAGERPMKDFRP